MQVVWYIIEENGLPSCMGQRIWVDAGNPPRSSLAFPCPLVMVTGEAQQLGCEKGMVTRALGMRILLSLALAMVAAVRNLECVTGESKQLQQEGCSSSDFPLLSLSLDKPNLGRDALCSCGAEPPRSLFQNNLLPRRQGLPHLSTCPELVSGEKGCFIWDHSLLRSSLPLLTDSSGL